nr:hypothetical protein [Tanacetum cinerariifolium]
VLTPQSSGDSHNDAMLATMNQIANLQSGKKVIYYNCRGEGHVARQCKEPNRARDSQWYHDKSLLMQAKEKGAMLDAEAEEFLADVECTAPYDQPLALTTTNLFEANHKDAYDSDADEGPHASIAFMANLFTTGGINDSSSSHINEVQISDDSFFSDVSYPLAQDMQQEEHLNSEVDSVLDDNMITYDEYQNDSRVEAVPTVVSADEADNKVKHGLDMAIVQRYKRNAELEEENVMLKLTLKSKVVSIENLQQKSKHLLSEKKTLEDKFLKEIVILTNANKVATNVLKGFQMPTHIIPMLSKRPNFASHDLYKAGLGYSNPRYGKQTRITQLALYDGHVLLNPNHPATRVYDSEESLVHAEVCKIKMVKRLGHALPINYAKLNGLQSSTPAKHVAPFMHTRPIKSDVHKKVLLEKKNMKIEMKNLLITNECSFANSIANDIYSIAFAYDLVVPPSSDSSHCMLEELRTTCDREHSKVLKLEAEILKKQQVINDVEKRCAQKTKIATLNAKTVGNKTSRTTKPVNPKVIAPGMYSISPKYIFPQRRTNRETPIPLPKKKQVTFQETPKPSPRFTKKPVAPLLMKPNVNVPLSTGIKSATRASKPESKSNAWIYRKLPAKSAKGEKVEEHIRNLNKNNRVDS